MWSKQRIGKDLEELHVGQGDAVLVHASMRSVGPVAGAADTMLEALLEAVGTEGTVMAPLYNSRHRLPGPLEAPDPALSPGGYQPDAVATAEVGVLAERIGRHPEARRSAHPTLSFGAIGRNATFLTDNAPFHFPLGANSPLARLHQINGKILLMGVGHTANTSIHLAEVWANVPYAHRKARVRTGEESWHDMEGSPGCSAGFAKIESILRQARILRPGFVGNAASQTMRAQFVVSMAREMLLAQPDCLLCDDPGCEYCAHARKMTRAQDAPETLDR